VLHWLLAGIGDIATKRVLPAILSEPRSRLHAVLTRDPAKAVPYNCKAYTNLDDALADPQIHAVYLATPVSLHHPQTLAALRAGKHVLCEKPTALNYPLAQEMAAAAQKSNKLCAVAYYRRLYPKLLRAKQLIAQGRIGQPVLAEFHNHYWFNAEAGHRAWLVDKSMAGAGPLYDIASHRIDLLNFFFGRANAATVLTSNAVHQNSVEDNATLLAEYPHGLRGLIDVRWHSHTPRDEARIVGTEGAIELSELNSGRLSAPGLEENLPPHQNLHFPLIENFVHAALDGAPLSSPIHEAIETDRVTQMALETAARQIKAG
jgi:1,5-anhydro-D-fructose reductase (1,5-anhydro-D-mannitol-forming)